jgi:hypothetical protein
VSGEINRLIALIRRGAGSLIINDPKPWIKSYEAFRNSFLKKDLKHKRVGILSQMEVNYLSTHYPEAAQAYIKFEADLAQADLTFVHNLKTHLRSVAIASARVESIANDIIQQRIRVLYPSAKGARARARKVPVSELISGLDGPTYISAFNPAAVTGKPKFSITDNVIENLEKDPDATRKHLWQQYQVYVRTIDDKKYHDDCLDWFEATLVARLNI